MTDPLKRTMTADAASTETKTFGVAETHITYDPEEEGAIRRKIDWHLIPALALLYLMSYLDRGNMGNAAIIGLRQDLDLTPGQYNLCLTIFFIPYSFFEVPSNIVLKFLRPSVWITIMMVVWGVIITLMGIVQGFSGLFAARFFLAVAEAGFFPAASYLLTTWYKRHEIQLRMGLFYSAGALSGAISGLLAYLIDKMSGVAGLEGWRWLFILEGILTVLIGASVILILPDSPAACSFLSEREKVIVQHRLQHDTGNDHSKYDLDEKFQKRHIWAGLKDWKAYVMVLVYWGSAIPIYGFIYTLPTVLTELGYTAAIAQLLTIPIYAAAVIALLTTAYLSDKAGTRSMYVIVPLLVGGAGLIVVLALPKGQYPGALYAMLFLVAMGLYSIICGTVAWTANNLAGPWKRSVGMALMISLGNLGGAAGTNIYLVREAPHYWTGYGVSLGAVFVSLCATVFLRWKLQRINAERDAMPLDEIHAKYTDQELQEMGDESPLFRYTI